MRHEDRRKEAGKMFIDVAKYSITAGILGNVLSEKMNISIMVIIFAVSVISFTIGFYTIPPKKEDK
ncbi:MAG: hypothetical protein M0Z64_07555 [Nitrospiraceae bacterium]|nr:hypothetical protein [Nitrospiraceae bacterium]